MAQQTAVEWLQMKMATSSPQEMVENINVWFKEAKQMEKEQNIGLLIWMNEISKLEPMRLETDFDDIVEQYYNETYGIK